MSVHTCLLPCSACGEVQLVPSSSTTVIRSGRSAMIAWGCPRCLLGRTNRVELDQADDALEGGARPAGLCMVVFKQCGGCETVTALPLSAFTVYVDAEGVLVEWSCVTCSPSCTNSFPAGAVMVELLRHQGATMVVTDVAAVAE